MDDPDDHVFPTLREVIALRKKDTMPRGPIHTCVTELQAIEQRLAQGDIYPNGSWRTNYVDIHGTNVTLDGEFHLSELEALVAVMRKYQRPLLLP